MVSETPTPYSRQFLNLISAYILFLFTAWIFLWLLKLRLDSFVPSLTGATATFLYWTVAKIFVWVLPSLELMRRIRREGRMLVGFDANRRSLKLGVAVAAVCAFLNISFNYALFGVPFHGFESLTTFLTAIVIAPIVEELTFRGAIFNGLLTGLGYWPANLLTAVLFLAIHLPGWYFTGKLASLSGIQLAVSICTLGVIFGATAYYGRSIFGSSIAHAVNNLTV